MDVTSAPSVTQPGGASLDSIAALLQQLLASNGTASGSKSSSGGSKNVNNPAQGYKPAPQSGGGLSEIATIMGTLGAAQPNPAVVKSREAVEMERNRRELLKERMTTKRELKQMAREDRRQTLIARLAKYGITAGEDKTVEELEALLANANRTTKKQKGARVGAPEPTAADLEARTKADRMAAAEAEGAALMQPDPYKVNTSYGQPQQSVDIPWGERHERDYKDAKEKNRRESTERFIKSSKNNTARRNQASE